MPSKHDTVTSNHDMMAGNHRYIFTLNTTTYDSVAIPHGAGARDERWVRAEVETRARALG